MILSVYDILLTPFYLLVIFLFARRVRNKNIVTNPVYKYYIPGLFAKMVGGIGVCLIYTFYYEGGDTVSYFQGGTAMVNLLFKSPEGFYSIMLGNIGGESWYLFDYSTGWPPWYMWRDPNTFFVIRFIAPLVLLAFKSFIVTAILLVWISYSGIWRLYLLFCEEFPQLAKQFAIAILFIPSVVFWGSGILKDTITFSAACWFTYSFYKLFVKRERMVFNALYLIVSSYLLVEIKPYILFALLPGTLIWLLYDKIVRIKSFFVKVIIAPVLIVVFVGVGYFIFNSMGSLLGDYSPEKVLEKAVITQEDLTRSYQYGQNYYDVGKFDASVSGIISKVPIAISATLFRPFLWEARNPVMLLSAIENTLILGLTIWLLLKLRIIGIFRLIGKHPLIIFALSFSLFFAFGVGLSTANFGALVRYKIPAIPFFVSALFILKYFYDQKVNRPLGFH